MKKLGIILTLLLLAIMPSMGQITNPYELTISHVRPCPDMTKKQAESKIWNWYMAQESAGYAVYLSDGVFYTVNIDKKGAPCAPGTGTLISFSLAISPVGKYYTMTVHGISIDSNPSIGRLYGHAGKLYEDCYTKRQLKLAKPILEIVVNMANELFKDFDNFINS